MVEINSGRVVTLHLEQPDLRAIDDGETVEVECPITGQPIYLKVGNVKGHECECCGQWVDVEEDAITPSARGLTERLLNGGTVRYDSVHTEEDIDLIIRADHEACGGWK